jgi:hypothetical protein
MASAMQTEESTVREPVGSGRFVREGSGVTHEEMGRGWRARWQEGAEALELEREPESDES